MFPALSRKVYGKGLVYFDNAATSQRSQSVIDRWNEISSHSNANIHRAVHRLADEATQAYESARDAVKEFLNAQTREEIIFTSGTTASVNLVAFSFGESYVREGDEIIVSEAEMEEAMAAVDPEFLDIMNEAAENIRKYHRWISAIGRSLPNTSILLKQKKCS